MRYEFPKDFLWGVATSAYQIEGAVDEDGRGESIWDVFSHTPGKIHSDENGDIACDHYHRYKEDVKSMAELGVKAYRFSISWCRIFPDGKKNLNEKGLDFYSKLVDELLKHEIKPFPTLYHWDLPQALQGNGGWENRETVNWFEKYSYTVFKRLGDRVKNWITLNEPFCSSFLGYVTGEHAPGYRNEVKRALNVAHNLLLAHGKSVKILREEVRGGRIGIANAVNIVSPASENEDDIRSARMVDEILNGWYHEPIASGRYPDELSKMYEFMGYMPEIGEDDMKIISEPMDFWGVNYYSRVLVKSNPEKFGGFEWVGGDLEKTDMGWEVYPKGIYEAIVKVRNYKELPVYITENGMADRDELVDGRVEDRRRIRYIKDHLRWLHKAIKEGHDVRGYFVWTLMDNFEWAHGYSKRFGLLYTDYRTLERIPKFSFNWYKEVISENGFEDDEELMDGWKIENPN